MQVQSLRPELERFVKEQVQAGHFSSSQALIEAAVEQMMLDSDEDLDPETVDAINRAEEQLDRGEGMEFGQFAAEMRRRMTQR